jgi:hypothetical protein
VAGSAANVQEPSLFRRNGFDRFQEGLERRSRFWRHIERVQGGGGMVACHVRLCSSCDALSIVARSMASPEE